MKTAELIGPALDWAVAKCEEIGKPAGFWTGAVERGNFNPSTNWAQSGPIIEREHIKLLHEASEVYSHDAKWWATADRDYEDPLHREYGPTPLIAAMRCYVTSKLGNEVDIPEKLCQIT